MIEHLKHMGEVRPEGRDRYAAQWAINEIEYLTAAKESREAEITRLSRAMTAVVQENERQRAALQECAAGWDSGPTTVEGAAQALSVEFQRRMYVAGLALTPSEGEGR